MSNITTARLFRALDSNADTRLNFDEVMGLNESVREPLVGATIDAFEGVVGPRIRRPEFLSARVETVVAPALAEADAADSVGPRVQAFFEGLGWLLLQLVYLPFAPIAGLIGEVILAGSFGAVAFAPGNLAVDAFDRVSAGREQLPETEAANAYASHALNLAMATDSEHGAIEVTPAQR